MDTILHFLNESRNSTLFPLIQWAGLAISAGLTMVMVGTAVCRDEVNAALRMANISHKEAAITMGISQGLLSRKLSGEKPLTFESLAPLPVIFWQWFYLLGAQHYGVPTLIQTGAEITHRGVL